MIRIEPKSGWTSDDADDLLRTLKDPKSGALTERRIILIKLTHKISGRDCIPQMSSKFLSKGYYPVVFYMKYLIESKSGIGGFSADRLMILIDPKSGTSFPDLLIILMDSRPGFGISDLLMILMTYMRFFFKKSTTSSLSSDLSHHCAPVHRQYYFP